jgi:hypothetical protein
MKKNVFKIVFLSLFIMIGGYGFYASQENVELSVTSLDNVEAWLERLALHLAEVPKRMANANQEHDRMQRSSGCK